MSDIIQRQITNLKKQNDGIETSLQNRGIPFNKMSVDISIPERELEVIRNYNEYLKEIVKNNKPQTQPQPKVVQKPVIQTIIESDDELEEKITHKTNCSLEDAKRAFFSKEYETFDEIINNFHKENHLRFYKANYKWADEKLGKPEYIAKNQVRGFIQMLDPFRKYLFVCFRCILLDNETKKYRFPSYWIVNADTDLSTLLSSVYDDFDFIEVNENETINKLLCKMRKNENENDVDLISEMYLN